MTEPGTAADLTPGPERNAAARPERDVVRLAIAMVLAAAAFTWATPNLTEPIRPTALWAVITVVVLSALFEYRVFYVEFEREAVAFSLSEVPTAFAIVFLSPWEALAVRVPACVAVMVVMRRLANYKVAFNAAQLMFELATVAFLLRMLLEVFGDDHVAVIFGLLVSLAIVTPLASSLIAIAISRFEGGSALAGAWAQIRSTWWLYPINAALGAVTVSMAMIEPALGLIGILLVFGAWYVLQRFGELGQRLRDLDEVHGFASRVGRSLQLDDIGTAAVTEAARLLHAGSAVLVRFDADGTTTYTVGDFPFDPPDDIDAPGWESLLTGTRAQLVDGQALRERGIVTDRPGVGPMIVAPVNDDTGPIAALLLVERERRTVPFDEQAVTRAQNLTGQLAANLRKGLLHEQLEFEARHDALTGLPARTLFERAVGDAVRDVRSERSSGVVAVLMLDLDRFKEVNDTLGHHAGDDLLVQFADRMSTLLGDDDLLSRLAGDEFAILCHRATSDEIFAFALECVREGGRPVTLDGLEIVVTVSVGVAEITADDRDAVQPMRRADIAMYNAKWQHTGVEFYRDEIDRRTPARLSMLGDLRTAIESDELDVVYQPKLHLATGMVVGAEALVRWQHATRGVVAPAEFVRVAEDTGLIKALTDLVLARGIATLRRLNEEGLQLGLAVNVSTHDLFDSRLPDRVRRYLEGNGVAPSLLTLEITESSLFVDAPRTRATIDELHAVGLRMAVDDFGTGYSSLNYLRRLPVHELKIDGSFVAGMLTDPQDEVIVRSTIDLGHNLGLLVVAEGVENLTVLERLSRFGCDVAQGFYISRPLAADELMAWVRKANSSRRATEPMAWLRSAV